MPVIDAGVACSKRSRARREGVRLAVIDAGVAVIDAAGSPVGPWTANSPSCRFAHDLRGFGGERDELALPRRIFAFPAGTSPAILLAMCLGVPGRVLSIDGDIAQVDFWGVTKAVRLDVIDTPVVPGDYILNHVGFAIRRIPSDDIAETLALYDELIREASSGDLMAGDVRGEIDATGEP